VTTRWSSTERWRQPAAAATPTRRAAMATPSAHDRWTRTTAAPRPVPEWVGTTGPAYLLLALFLVAFPFVANNFWTVQIGAQALFLGVIALSLMFLAGYGGMVSLSQMTVAGIAGYMVAILGVSNNTGISLGWPWWAAVPASLAIATLVAFLIGVLSVRTAGIYTIMITIAIGVAFFYFTRQNYAIFNGHSGFAGLAAPVVLGVDWRSPRPFYFLSLGIAVLSYAAVLYLSRSTFGLSLQAIRDNARRMNALGFNVVAHRLMAHTAAGFVAALGGVLYVWLNGRVSPGTIDTGPVLNVLIIAVLGGLGHPIGPFLGAVVFVLIENFAIDLIAAERFNTLIGMVFLMVVLFSPDGLLGLWRQLVTRARAAGSSGGRLGQRH
jgi:branched-chain amino acid transport system permease protein